MRVTCTPNKSNAETATKAGSIGVCLYSSKGTKCGGVGHQVITAFKRLGGTVSVRAWDLVSVGLAVTAADTFIRRVEAADSWTRIIEIEIGVQDPSPWNAVKDQLSSTLCFLSGDTWHFAFTAGGCAPPSVRAPTPGEEDCVCLFSGGLDSFIGTLDLFAKGNKPLLVSHAYAKERITQDRLAIRSFKSPVRRLCTNVAPMWHKDENDVSMRTRSFLFLALAAAAASTLKVYGSADPVSLFIPENGFISVNPPLTYGRIGSLSTRTTHPHFLSSFQKLLQSLAINVTLDNPYQLLTKGEMLKVCKDQGALRRYAHETVSCGKWKRLNKQCGRCIPCLIRRAALFHAKLRDATQYRYGKLSRARTDPDLLSMRIALQRNKKSGILRKWLLSAGTFQGAMYPFNEYVKVASRGFKEIETFLRTNP